MTKWTKDAIDAPHTQRELDQIQQGVTPAQAAQWMNEAVDDETHKLRARIEQLERELAEARGLERDTYAASKAAFVDLQAELAAEKALADELHDAWHGDEGYIGNPVADAYHKARGM